MKTSRFPFVVIISALALLMSVDIALAQNSTIVPVGNIKPPSTKSFDIGWVDNSTGNYFLADRSNNAVDMFNASAGTFTGYIAQGSFVGVKACPPGVDPHACSGPNGIVTDSAHLVWAGDGNSTIKVMNPSTSSGILASIATGGQYRADELAYDPRDQVIVVANDAEGFLTFINVSTRSVATHFYYADNTVGATPTVAGHSTAGNGIEQSVWNPATGLFYQAVPANSPATTGFIDVFTPSGTLVNTISVPGCTNGPTGLALGRNATFMGACDNGGAVIEAGSGHLRTIVSGVGGADEIWFNPGDGNFYFGISDGSTGQVGAVNGADDRFIALQNGGGHSVAAYAGNNHIFAPDKTGANGIYVYASQH